MLAASRAMTAFTRPRRSGLSMPSRLRCGLSGRQRIDERRRAPRICQARCRSRLGRPALPGSQLVGGNQGRGPQRHCLPARGTNELAARYLLPEGKTMQDILRTDAELLASEASTPQLPGFEDPQGFRGRLGLIRPRSGSQIPPAATIHLTSPVSTGIVARTWKRGSLGRALLFPGLEPFFSCLTGPLRIPSLATENRGVAGSIPALAIPLQSQKRRPPRRRFCARVNARSTACAFDPRYVGLDGPDRSQSAG